MSKTTEEMNLDSLAECPLASVSGGGLLGVAELLGKMAKTLIEEGDWSHPMNPIGGVWFRHPIQAAGALKRLAEGGFSSSFSK
jgi:hypothetical protein